MRAALLALSFLLGLSAASPAADEAAIMKTDVKLFTDREYAIDEMPEAVQGLPFHRTSIEKTDVTVTKPDTLLALTPTIRPKASTQEEALQKGGLHEGRCPRNPTLPWRNQSREPLSQSGEGG